MRDSQSLEASSTLHFATPTKASFPILTNDVPELGVISPLRGGRKRYSVLFQDSVLVPSSRDLQLNSPRWKSQSLSITLNIKPKSKTEFLTCLPDCKAYASLMIKTTAGNVSKASWSVRQLGICLNTPPFSFWYCSSKANPKKKQKTSVLHYWEGLQGLVRKYIL